MMGGEWVLDDGSGGVVRRGKETVSPDEGKTMMRKVIERRQLEKFEMIDLK